jgi:hypothetical protein
MAIKHAFQNKKKLLFSKMIIMAKLVLNWLWFDGFMGVGEAGK